MSRKSVFIHSKRLDEIGYPDHCPFNTKRAGKVLYIASSEGLFNGSDSVTEPPSPASRKTLETFHTKKYLDEIINAENGKLTRGGFEMGIGTSDCPVFKHMTEYLSLSAGATITGAKMILKQKADIAFNPSGGFHHAGPSKASGFCFINDIVLGAQTLLNAGKRVALLDIDVHHFDGVQNAFYSSGQIMKISMHQDGKTLFPGTGFVNETGNGKGKGFCVNIPLPPGTHNKAYYRAFSKSALPLLKSFNPDIIMLEIGMDTLAGDPLADLSLSNSIYINILEDIINLGRPILATGGGGYNFNNTVRGWTLVWSVLSDNYQDDISMGMGGVLLENTDWLGGLIDRKIGHNPTDEEKINKKVDKIIEEVNSTLFPIHKLQET